MDPAELDKRFDLHPATAITGPTMDSLRTCHKSLAAMVTELTPPSREQSLAITALEEALFWANAAVARNTEEPQS